MALAPRASGSETGALMASLISAHVAPAKRCTQPVMLPLIVALGNHIIKEIGLVERINETVRWDASQWEISPGMLAKAMILATLTDMRAPLTHVSSRYAGLDTEFLFGSGVTREMVNEYNLGEMLDRLSEQDCNELYRNIALTMGVVYAFAVNRMHADTTTISFYGEYDMDLNKLSATEQEEILQIKRGYNKDGKPQCKQVVVGQIVKTDWCWPVIFYLHDAPVVVNLIRFRQRTVPLGQNVQHLVQILNPDAVR